MIIGTSRVGIGRIGIRDAQTIPFVYANMSILDRRTAEAYANMSIVEVFGPYILANMDIDAYNHREMLANMSIIAAIYKMVSSNISIADLIAKSVLANMSIIQTQLLSVIANISILGNIVIPILSNMSICGPVDKQALANMSIADLIALTVYSNMSISGFGTPGVLANINIANLRASNIAANMDIIDNRYWAIGPEGVVINISGKVYEPQSNGFGIKTSIQRMADVRRINLRDDGIEGGERKFLVIFKSDSERQTFQEEINNDSSDLVLFCGRSDRYHLVKKVSVEPEYDELWKGQAALKINCKMEDPYLYHFQNQGIDLLANPLPMTGTYKYNYGSVEAPILFRIGGFYSGGQLLLPIVTMINGTENTVLAIGPGLLSNEYAELTLEGSQKYYLEHTYEDTFSSNDAWQYDVVQSGGCSLAGGQVSVPSGAWFYYRFQGYPTKENISLLATITKTGSPIVQYSTDGITWVTSLAASEIVSATQTAYDLTGTEKLSTVYIRFYSPAGSSMTIQDVSFSMLRDVSGQYAQIPMIPAGESRALRITGSGSARAQIKTTFRARWHPQ
jgi:hypothetical protein